MHQQAQLYFEQGRFQEAAAIYRELLKTHPEPAEIYFHLGNALWKAGDFKGAIAAQRNSLRIAQSVAAFNSMGLALVSDGQVDEAMGAFQKALKIEPHNSNVLHNLGSAQRSVGAVVLAMTSFSAAITAGEKNAASEAMLFTSHYVSAIDRQSLGAAHRAWGRLLEQNVRQYAHAALRDSRPLRIGFVSGDFNAHAATRFLLPLFQKLDRSQFELYLFSNISRADERTSQYQSLATVWRDIRNLNDDQAAHLIHEDKIDVLFDLSLHTEGNRLGVFAQKPAPVQATWLGYASTTGLHAVDYRLSDRFLDPNPDEDQQFVEKTLRLTNCFWCFQQFDVTPAVGPSPIASAGQVTFGSLNNFAKVNDQVQALWAKILASVPNSRIIIHSPPGSHRGLLRQYFAAEGVAATRIEFVGFQQTPDYLALHNRIDMALDPFPFAGGTTTCDALWMGVPVVTLAGKTPVGRGGVSILQNVGLPELIAETPEQYVQIAVDLAGDPARLAQYRLTLRDRVAQSTLTNASRFSRNFESAIREMWLGKSE
jgi:protein O-GlcNAc transferase